MTQNTLAAVAARIGSTASRSCHGLCGGRRLFRRYGRPAVLCLVLLWHVPVSAAAPLTFAFQGMIEEKRDQGRSVFSGAVGETFAGTFSYDTDAEMLPDSDDDSKFFPLLGFSIDDAVLDVTPHPNDVGSKSIGLHISVFDLSYGTSITIRGIHAPAITTAGDNGSTWLTLGTWYAPIGVPNGNDGNLPTSIDLDAYCMTRSIRSPSVPLPSAPPTNDVGVIVEITLVPEPGAAEVLLAASFAMWLPRRRRNDDASANRGAT